MSKIAVVYWSGTGNTEQMANCVAEGVQAAGGQADLLQPSQFDGEKLGEYDAVAFGCPAMGRRSWRRASSPPCSTAWRKI